MSRSQLLQNSQFYLLPRFIYNLKSNNQIIDLYKVTQKKCPFMKSLQGTNASFHQDRDQLHYQMALKSYKQQRQNGQLQSVEQIFGRLPLPRLEKDHYSFLFDNIKSNIENILSKQNILEKIQSNEQSLISKIEVKNFRDVKFVQEADIAKERLKSGLPIFKCIIYLRSQDQKIFQEHQGESIPFLPDQKYIDLHKIEEDITNTRTFLESEKPMRSYMFQFIDQNTIEFKSRGFPTHYQIQKRAETLAKLYILNLYRDQARKMRQLNKLDELQLNHQRQIKKIKQQLEVQKLKQGQLIEQMDLIKQVHKIYVLIERKMNQMAYDQFSARKNGQRARQIKRSLQKLKQNLGQQLSAKIKLRMLIAYKHKKGW